MERSAAVGFGIEIAFAMVFAADGCSIWPVSG
jgi:hypothetical protein